jgi:ureidoglycolate hydrolase
MPRQAVAYLRNTWGRKLFKKIKENLQLLHVVWAFQKSSQHIIYHTSKINVEQNKTNI